MSNKAIIANRYAKALFELSQEENTLYPVYVSLQEISKLLEENNELKAFIHNPLLSLEERIKIITSLFENKIPKILFKFILFLNFKGRLNVLDEVFMNFDELYLTKNNQMRANLEVAYALDDTQKDNLRQKLSLTYSKEIILISEIKKELLGGFRFLTAGMLYDSSIKSQLEQFKQKVSL